MARTTDIVRVELKASSRVAVRCGRLRGRVYALISGFVAIKPAPGNNGSS